MASAKMTLIGFKNYMESLGDDLFANLNTPTGIDKNLVINNILMLGGEYEVLWGDPFFYKTMIGVWSDKWQHTMLKWYEAINAHFDPVENYDRIEDWSDTGVKRATETNTKKEKAVANDYSKSTGSGTNESKRSTYDSATYQPHDKDETSSEGTNISTGLTQADGTVLNNTNAVDTSMHKGRIHGNIGVKTAQSMIEESLSLYNWNLYDAIAELFIGEMLIYVDD